MRVKRGTKARRRRKKVLERASGYRGANSRCFITAIEKNDRALAYSHRDRHNKKREVRQLWTIRINAAARLNGTTYSRLIHGLKEANIELDRKTLADLAIRDAGAFSALVQRVSSAQA